MYTVLVAEDEPLALKNICSIVEKYCPEYRVIATARDGASALEKIRQVRPDVVVSDIIAIQIMIRISNNQLYGTIPDNLPG